MERADPELTTVPPKLRTMYRIDPDTELRLVHVILRSNTGLALANQTYFIGTTTTITIVTHIGTVFPQDHVLVSAGTVIDQGNFTITATSTNIYCTVMVFDAGASSPIGIPLHMVRFNPMAGSTE